MEATVLARARFSFYVEFALVSRHEGDSVDKLFLEKCCGQRFTALQKNRRDKKRNKFQQGAVARECAA